MHITTWDPMVVSPHTTIQPSRRIETGSLNHFISGWISNNGGNGTNFDKPHHLILSHPWRDARMPNSIDMEDATEFVKAVGTYARNSADRGCGLLGIWLDHPPVGMLRREQSYMDACENSLLRPLVDVLSFANPIPVSQYGIAYPHDERLPLCPTVWSLSGAASVGARVNVEPERDAVCWLRGPWQYSKGSSVITPAHFSAMLSLCRLAGIKAGAVFNDGRRHDRELIERGMAYAIDWHRGAWQPWEHPQSIPGSFDFNDIIDILSNWDSNGMNLILEQLAREQGGDS